MKTNIQPFTVNGEPEINESLIWWGWDEKCDLCGEVLRINTGDADTCPISTVNPNREEIDLCPNCIKRLQENKISYTNLLTFRTKVTMGNTSYYVFTNLHDMSFYHKEDPILIMDETGWRINRFREYDAHPCENYPYGIVVTVMGERLHPWQIRKVVKIEEV